MQSPDQNVERNRQLLLDRSLVGLKKYGVTTERDDLTLNEWLQHLLEELLDAANYVQAAMNNAAPDTFAQRFSMYEGMLLWILYHHQGGKSTIGQPIRRLLGIKQHAPLSAMQVQHAEAVARMYGSPNNLHAEPSATDTTPPTLCQTIHLGQPGVTVEPCLMLGPDEEEVACLLFTAPGTEVRLTWPTQTQALAVLAAATAEDCIEADAQPVACECGDSYPPGSYGAGFIEGRGHCANCAAGAGEMASLLGVCPAPAARVEREAQQSEPVAIWDDMTKLARATSNRRIKHGAPLYATPQPAAPAAQDVAVLVESLSWIERTARDSNQTSNMQLIQQKAARALTPHQSIGAAVVNQQLTTEPGPAVPLAAKHHGMCISARGLLSRVVGPLKGGAREMLKHLEEMADRYYAGDLAAVDEFLQLYCLDEKRPAEQKETN